MTERWRQILEIMDEAYADYLSRRAALRKRVVGDVKRKLSDGRFSTVPIWSSRQHRRGRLRGIGVREAADLAAEVRPRSRQAASLARHRSTACWVRVEDQKLVIDSGE